RELSEGARVVVGHADPPDAAGIALALEPVEMLAPEHEIVHLLDFDAAVPRELTAELLTPFVERPRPDLRRDDGAVATAVERCAERALRAAVHRRRVEDADAGLVRRAHHLARQARVGVERVPGAEPDDRPEAARFHASTLPGAV